MKGEYSYATISDRPRALEWRDYADAARRSLAELLSSGECRESQYQRFLELNPSFLPWFYGTFGAGHHGLTHGAIVSQPRLVGIRGKQPDFLMITRDSASVYAVLIEIESPCKRWFTKEGSPTADLTQAIGQLRSWKAWFEEPGKLESFSHEYQVPRAFRDRRFEQRYILIYGRRTDLLESGFAYLRSQQQQPDERFLSYDHLDPNEHLDDAVTARLNGNGYKAVSIPPTFQNGPFQAGNLVMVGRKEDAADAHSLMPVERAAFLRQRFAYWDAWAKQENRGPYGFDTE
jgi:hypothetical protein